MDELASRAKMDPIAYRMKLLTPDAKKLRACVIPWKKERCLAQELPAGTLSDSPVTRASTPELRVPWKSRSRTIAREFHRVTVAVDPAVAVNPLTIESQLQGGLGFGVSQLMAKGAITLKNGRVEQQLRRLNTALYNGRSGYRYPYRAWHGKTIGMR